MTKETFCELVNSVTVQDVQIGGIYIKDMTRDELSEIVTLAGIQLGEFPADVKMNPEWLAIGPQPSGPVMVPIIYRRPVRE